MTLKYRQKAAFLIFLMKAAFLINVTAELFLFSSLDE